jgi:uncharacterized protein involved in exopolysaccharide biosynthesis
LALLLLPVLVAGVAVALVVGLVRPSRSRRVRSVIEQVFLEH